MQASRAADAEGEEGPRRQHDPRRHAFGGRGHRHRQRAAPPPPRFLIGGHHCRAAGFERHEQGPLVARSAQGEPCCVDVQSGLTDSQIRHYREEGFVSPAAARSATAEAAGPADSASRPYEADHRRARCSGRSAGKSHLVFDWMLGPGCATPPILDAVGGPDRARHPGIRRPRSGGKGRPPTRAVVTWHQDLGLLREPRPARGP